MELRSFSSSSLALTGQSHGYEFCRHLSARRQFRGLLHSKLSVLLRTRLRYRNPRICAETEIDLSDNEREYVTSVREAPDVSVWDSNAEGVRRSWTTRRTSSSSTSRESGPAAAESRDVRSDDESNWPWWLSGPDDDAYDEAFDEDEEEDLDVLSVMSSLLRWMLPAAAIFFPWLFGGPMFIMMAFAFFPLAQKLLGFLLPAAWKVLLQGWNFSQSKHKRYKRDKKREMNRDRQIDFWTWIKYGQSETSDDFEEDFYSPDDWARTRVRNSVNRGNASKLAGWEDLEEDFLVLQKRSVGNKRMGLQKRRKKKEVPLFFRLVIALFPFLRSWGGFL